jgi:hypothetical protein
MNQITRIYAEAVFKKHISLLCTKTHEKLIAAVGKYDLKCLIQVYSHAQPTETVGRKSQH